MFFKIYQLFFFILLFAITACKKNPSKVPEKAVDIYVGGTFTATNASTSAAYWKNGVQIPLQDSLYGSSVNGIAVNGSDVYLSGSVYSASNPHGTYTHAAVWKNGSLTKLHDNLGSNATGIILNGNDVYVTGTIIATNGVSVAAYWKNGVAVILADSLLNSAGTAILVKGNDVYVAGVTVAANTSYSETATYWKNGVATKLGESALSAGATGIAVSGTDVYVSGNLGNEAFFWKNGIATKLLERSSTSFRAGSILINGNDVYVAGRKFNTKDNPIAIYWKNGIPVKLVNNSLNEGTDAQPVSAAFSISLDGNDVYLSGYNSSNKAAYWKNGIPVEFGLASSAGLCMVVVPR